MFVYRCLCIQAIGILSGYSRDIVGILLKTKTQLSDNQSIASKKCDHGGIWTRTPLRAPAPQAGKSTVSPRGLKQKKSHSPWWTTFCDLAGARTQDPIIKSDVLYQLSYQVEAWRKWKICDLAGARTQDPIIKSDVLYQLSYQVINISSMRVQI